MPVETATPEQIEACVMGLKGTIDRQAATIDRQGAEIARLQDALEWIESLDSEWRANNLGGVSLQRKRWQKMGAIARGALQETADD